MQGCGKRQSEKQSAAFLEFLMNVPFNSIFIIYIYSCLIVSPCIVAAVTWASLPASPMFCSRTSTKGQAGRQACSDMPSLQFGGTTEGLYQTATFEGQDVQRKKPEAGTVPDRLQGSSGHTHAWLPRPRTWQATEKRRRPPFGRRLLDSALAL